MVRTARLDARMPAMRKLESYDFPGNVRELENMLERAVALSSSPLIGASDLPDPRAGGSRPRDRYAERATERRLVDLLDRLVADFGAGSWCETRALDQTGGVRKRAAVLLGVSFRSLRYRLEKLGIDKGADRRQGRRSRLIEFRSREARPKYSYECAIASEKSRG